MQRVAAIADQDELAAAFRDDRARLRFLERLRYPNGFRCPRCGGQRQPTRPRPGVIVCAGCQWFTTVTADTSFRDARVPLARWFALYWAIAEGELLPTRRALRAFLGLVDARPQAIAAAAVLAAAEEEPLAGAVELDGRIIEHGGKLAMVLVAAERLDEGVGRVRIARTATLGRHAVRRFAEQVIAAGSAVHTDCWSGYLALDELPLEHRMDGPGTDPDQSSLRRVDATMRCLRRWLRKHPVSSADDLVVALDGFCLVFNRATRRSTGAVFCHLLQGAFTVAGAHRRKRKAISGVRRIDVADGTSEDELETG